MNKSKTIRRIRQTNKETERRTDTIIERTTCNLTQTQSYHIKENNIYGTNCRSEENCQ